MAKEIHFTRFGTGDYSNYGETIDTLMFGIEDSRVVSWNTSRMTQTAQPGETCILIIGFSTRETCIWWRGLSIIANFETTKSTGSLLQLTDIDASLKEAARLAERCLFTFHSSLFTLHPSLFTLHSSPFTLHPSPFQASREAIQLACTDVQTDVNLAIHGFRLISTTLTIASLHRFKEAATPADEFYRRYAFRRVADFVTLSKSGPASHFPAAIWSELIADSN